MNLPKTLLSKQYNTISNMSQPTIAPPEKPVGGQKVTTATAGNVIPTDKEVAKAAEGQAPPPSPPSSSSINPNAAENGKPVYTSEHPLMAAPTPEQLAQQEPPLQSLATQEVQPSRSNPSEEPQTVLTAAQQEQPVKHDFSQTDATIQGLLIQAMALYHNKSQILQQQQQQ